MCVCVCVNASVCFFRCQKLTPLGREETVVRRQMLNVKGNFGPRQNGAILVDAVNRVLEGRFHRRVLVISEQSACKKNVIAAQNKNHPG